MDIGTCVECGKDFERNGYRKTSLFCSNTCRRKRHIAKQRKIREKTYGYSASSVDTGKVGAIGESQVCCDLIRKGYTVFRSVSQSASCDLIALKEKNLLRIEVKSSWRKEDGSLGIPTTRIDHSNFDILALVLKDEIKYVPSKYSINSYI